MSENINQIEPQPDSLSLVEINANINNFLKQTQSQFELLKEFLQREFVARINNLEEKVELTDSFLQEMLALKNCLLEVQLRFFEMRNIHHDSFLVELETMIMLLVQRIEHLETHVKNKL